MQNIRPFKALEDTSLCFRDRDSVHIVSSWTPSLSHQEWSTRGSRFKILKKTKVSSMQLLMSLCGRCLRDDILQVSNILPVCCVVGVLISLCCCLYHPRQGGFVFWTGNCMSLLVMFVWHVLVLLLSKYRAGKSLNTAILT